MKNERGYTLIEMLIALAVFALVMAGVYSVMNVGLGAQQKHRAETLQNARAAFDAVTKSLRSAIVMPGNGSYSFTGDAASVTFYTLPSGAKEPTRIEYYIGNSEKCKGLCRRVFPEPFNDSAPLPDEEPIAPEVSTMTFSFFDGTAWQSQWSSAEALPESVRIGLTVRNEDGSEQKFETAAATVRTLAIK